MYGKLIEGKINYAPANFMAPNDCLILNFNKNIGLMKEYGFKLIVEDIPSYDPNKYDLYVYEYVETDDSITIVYKTRDKIIYDDPELTNIKNRLHELEQQNEKYQIIFSEEVNKC
jgi:hypothetical protein